MDLSEANRRPSELEAQSLWSQLTGGQELLQRCDRRCGEMQADFRRESCINGDPVGQHWEAEIAEVPGGLDVHRPRQARASGGINVTAHQSDGVNELRQAPKVIHVQMRDEDASHARDRDAVAIQECRDWLAAVEEVCRRAVQQGHRWVVARRCGKRTAGPEDHKLAHKHHCPHANGLLDSFVGGTTGTRAYPGAVALATLAGPATHRAVLCSGDDARCCCSLAAWPLSLAGRRRLKVNLASPPLRRAVVYDRILHACWEVGS